MATVNYTKKIELKYWCVSLEDIKKISNIISQRMKTDQRFSAGFESGLTIETTNINEFLIALELKTGEKEILEEIKIYSSKSNQTLKKRKTILLKFDFKYSLNWSSCNVITEDEDGSLKDWALGTYEEIGSLTKSLEIDNKYKNYYEKRAKDKLLFDPYNKLKEEIMNEEKKDNENKVINHSDNNIEKTDKNHKSYFKNLSFEKATKIISAIIIALLSLLGGSKYILSFKKIDNFTENNVRSENQTGGITANNVTVYQQTSDSNNPNLPSAFSFLDKIGKFDTTLERDNYIKTISGMEVGDSGYIDDVSNGYDSITYFVTLKKTISASKFIMCKTDEKNTKIAILAKSSKSIIKFKGHVTSGQVLNSCEFQ